MSAKTIARGFAAGCLAVTLIVGFGRTGDALVIPYLASSTGQTATVDYSFVDGNTLQLIVTETTPAATFTGVGAGGILTSVGFLLPGTATLTSTGTVTVQPGSISVGFSGGVVGAGTDVSNEWGAAVGGEANMGDVGDPVRDFVSVNTAHMTQFTGVNRDNPAELDGPQGGLLDDSTNAGGLGVIDNSVKILIDLDQTLSNDNQTAFLIGLWSTSTVEYGSDAAFGTPVPEPATLLLLGSGLAGLGLFGRKRITKRDQE